MRLHLLTTLLFTSLSSVLGSQDYQGQGQIPMMSEHHTTYTPQTSIKPTLADLLTIETSASIFYSYARELELSERLSDTREKTTIFVPSNRAVMSMVRKPHEGPTPLEGDDIHISEMEFDKRSKKNVERWISAHMIPESVTSLEPGQYPTLLAGKSIKVSSISKAHASASSPAWSRLVLEDGVHITGMKEGLNGVLYFTDGTIESNSA